MLLQIAGKHPEGAFNQEKALVRAFSVIVKTGCGTDGALHSTRTGAGVERSYCQHALTVTAS